MSSRDGWGRAADLVFEAGVLARTPRSGWAVLRAPVQDVAQHSHRAALVGLLLADATPGADACRVAALCTVHDLPEARVGDLHHLAKRYAHADEHAALNDATSGVSQSETIRALFAEHDSCESLESHLAHDADVIEMIASLVEARGRAGASEEEIGRWLDGAATRLRTEAGRTLAAAIRDGDPDRWHRAPDLQGGFPSPERPGAGA